ncbi:MULTISPECIES: type VI secretion system Vgr family protein [unclassified Azospirillum]|uniref:type VI secretion system Vgr family protein n=1 Tax=unclassified Azospirillum TaxID=2630922 RepID=UPI000B6DE7AC|nr:MULTISPECIES: type VI secretion system tip protein TssI/VgrG [unclassified Azospirillum]SNS92569.1 type VI secretion system secreted protein VgrG [Azospirillum sp. RU38E]SNT09471.1 type VI secretion system secreted protein VgrG [Azospirillum sp. RU37A]
MLTQVYRDISVLSSLGEDVLLFRRMSGHEELGGLFLYHIDVLTMLSSVDFDAVLGREMSVRVTSGSSVRYFHGLVSRFTHLGSEGRYGLYRAEVRPWLWFLTRNRDSRIFQGETVPEIVKKVLRGRGFTDLSDRLSGTYLPWEYCVQYQESDYAFISRLLEHEGIYYYFSHENGRHVLVLADGAASHDPLSPSSQVRFQPEKRQRERLRVVTGWTLSREVTAGTHIVDDYDFENPRAQLRTPLSMPHAHEMSGMEVYEYPSNMAYQPSGRRGENAMPYARVRLEAQQGLHETILAESNVTGLAAGMLFRLTHHPISSQNREYLVTQTSIEMVSDAYEGGGGGDGEQDTYLCRIALVPGTVPFRTPRRTPWPRMGGPQTAMVVGKAGEEIWTDRHGRIKVHFPWDREGNADENSSCWVRVAQAWAGRRWGAQFLPRVGQEVVVSFLDGDPNRPLVTGAVYNGEAQPPFGLPERATQSGWRSSSSKGGAGGNEFRFEDKAGREQVFIHAQRALDVKVRASHRESMGGDRHQTVGRDKKAMVEGNHHDIVWTDRYQNVDANYSQMVGLDNHEEIGQNYALKAGLEVAVEAGLSISLKASGGFITIGPTGVTISGNLVLVNSGGSPSALQAQVTEPDEAQHAPNSEPGKGGGVPRARRISRLAANRRRIAAIANKRAAAEWAEAKAKADAERKAAAEQNAQVLAKVKENEAQATALLNGTPVIETVNKVIVNSSEINLGEASPEFKDKFKERTGMSLEESIEIYKEKTSKNLDPAVVEMLFTSEDFAEKLTTNNETIHKEYRYILNMNAPKSEKEAIERGFIKMKDYESIYHSPVRNIDFGVFDINVPEIDPHVKFQDKNLFGINVKVPTGISMLQNSKYVSKDGYQEAVFDKNGDLVTDEKYVGSFNFFPSRLYQFWKWSGHTKGDINPYKKLGN